jgi:hypothetical protein
MPFTLPTANAGGDAPEVDDGLALLRFDDLVLTDHPDWAGTDNYGKPDSGQRFHFVFTLLVPTTREVVYKEDGDPIELEALTRTATGERSNFAALMSGLLTPQEFAAWQVATDEAPFDASAAQGRIVNAKVAHNKKGWPFVEEVIGIALPAAKKTKAELKAEAAALLAAAEESE